MSPGAEEIAGAARAWLGTPYRHQAATLGAGCDCLGLLRGVWRTLYGNEPAALPNYRADWRDQTHAAALLAIAGRLLLPVETARPGRVLLFRMRGAAAPKHCGILVEPGRFIHAQERLGVVEADFTQAWRRRVGAVFGFPERG